MTCFFKELQISGHLGKNWLNFTSWCIILHVLPVQGKVLQRIPGLSHEAAAVVWTMVERQDPESTLSHFWRALPQHLGTGLSVREGDLHRALPRGSPLREEAEAARKVRGSWRAGGKCGCAAWQGQGWVCNAAPQVCLWAAYQLTVMLVSNLHK